jgi:outer membrane protein
MKRYIMILALLTFGGLAAFGQTSGATEDGVVLTDHAWTLQECIDYALEHNISVQQQKNTVSQRELDLNTAKNSRLPGLSADASQNYSFGRGLTADNTYANTNTSSTGLSLGASANLFNGFNTKNTIELNQLNLQAATADLDKAKDDIRMNVAAGYVQILYDMEIRDVAEHQISIDSLQVVRLKAMLQNGKASVVEVSQQEATLAKDYLTMTQAENDLRIAQLNLSQLLELPSPEGFSVVRPSFNMDSVLLTNPDEIYSTAVTTRPGVLAEQYRLSGTEKSINIAKSAMYPSLSLSGGLGTNYYTTSNGNADSFSKQLNNNFSQYVGLSLSIPIFNKFSTRNSIRSAQLSQENQRLQLESTKKSLYKEIQQAYYNAVASQSKYFSSKQACQSAETSFNQVSAKYENGKANITEFNESKNQYLEAESNLVQAEYEYIYQSKLLDFYKGQELKF